MKRIKKAVIDWTKLFTQQYVLNLSTRQIHDTSVATGRCKLDQIAKYVESDDFRFLRNYNAAQVNRPNRVCDHCIGDQTGE